MRRALFTLVACALGASLTAVGCSQTPVVVPLRSMERPKDVDFLCMQQIDATSWRGVPLNRCHVDQNTYPQPYLENGTLEDPNQAATENYHLHAVVTQLARGELAVVDLGNGPNDSASTIVKVDPRIPGYTFLPVGAVPEDVVADPRGKAVYVASGKLVTDGTSTPHYRIDVIPSEILRGPVDTDLEQAGASLPWPHIELSVDDGAPTRMAAYDDAVRNDGTGHDRLYVALPDAKGGPKIAVFEIGCALGAPITADCPTALLPQRLADITLSATASPKLDVTALSCGDTKDRGPWWLEYEKACYSPANQSPNPPKVLEPEVVPPEQIHLGGIDVAAGLLYVADDGAPFIHVFDISAGKGDEIERISVGAKISRLSVSPPVPDELTFKNGNAVMVCEVNGWVGDGLPHTDSALVREQLGGHCIAHRYIYAIDYQDARLGDGTVEVIDLPVVYQSLDIVDLNPAPGAPVAPQKVRVDKPDFLAMKLEQPMGCDTPALPATRIPLGSFAINGSYGVPARAVTFVTYNPPTPLDVGQFDHAPPGTNRCRSWGTNAGTGAENLFPTTIAGAPIPGASNDELDVVPGGADRNQLQQEQNSWQSTVGPTFMHGTFAFVALDNGPIAVVDVDDYDSLCRGPKTVGDIVNGSLFYPTQPNVSGLLKGGSTQSTSTPNASGEYTYAVSRRHHPRSSRLLNGDDVPAVSSIILQTDPTTTATGLPWGVQSPEQRVRAHMFPVIFPGETSTVTQGLFVRSSADNPFGYAQETWTVTFEGALAGFGGSGGTLDLGGNVFKDPGGNFCERGVEAFDGDPFVHNDVVQITDDVCLDSTSVDNLASHTLCDSHATFADKTPVTHDGCVARFGLSTDASGVNTLDIRRDLIIGKAFDDHVEVAQHYEVDPSTRVATLVPGYPTDVEKCFPGLVRYVVRARNAWTVLGSATGFLHRVVQNKNLPTPDPALDPTQCVIDKSKPIVYAGRVREIPGTAGTGTDPTLPDGHTTQIDLSDVTQVCPTKDAPEIFVNPYWTFAIQQGWDTNANGGAGAPVPTPRDSTFIFGGRFDYFPYLAPGGSLPTTVRALQKLDFSRCNADGTSCRSSVDLLNWDMISLVDAVDKGLGIFFVYDFNTSKVFE